MHQGGLGNLQSERQAGQHRLPWLAGAPGEVPEELPGDIQAPGYLGQRKFPLGQNTVERGGSVCAWRGQGDPPFSLYMKYSKFLGIP